MKKEDISKSSFVVRSSASIGEAMGAITDNQRGCVAVVNDSGAFVGVVSDGDIRRAQLSGATLLAPVQKIVNMNATTVGDPKEAEGVFAAKSEVNILPVVGENNKLVDVLVRDPKKRKA